MRKNLTARGTGIAAAMAAASVALLSGCGSVANINDNTKALESSSSVPVAFSNNRSFFDLADLKREKARKEKIADVQTLPPIIDLQPIGSTDTIVVKPLPKPDRGDLLKYKVQKGDTLSHIALRHGTSVQTLMQANGLVDSLIHPGQRLALSGSSSSPAPAAPVSSGRLARIRALHATAADVEVLARIIKGETPAHTPFAGQVAVGAVVLNRVLDSRWPGSIRGVAHQRLQFSAYNANVRQRLYHGPIPAYAWRAARAALAGQDPTAGATHYYNPFLVRPAWAKQLRFIKQIGSTVTTAHVFYR